MDNRKNISVSGATDVFISYSSKDEDVAERIVEGLTERGVRCWKAGKYTINSGDDFREKIATALDECKIFLLILSKHSMSTPWVRIELTEALRKNKKIYSLRVDDEPLDELFEFKLGCSQISDGTRGLIPAIENLSINIKRDRDALLEKEKTDIYDKASSYNFFNLSILNDLLFLFNLILTVARVIMAKDSIFYDNMTELVLAAVGAFIPLLAFYVFLRIIYGVLLRKYNTLGCLDAQYLFFKKYSKPFGSKEKQANAISALQNAARRGSRPALIKLSRMLEHGKKVPRDTVLAKEYADMAKHADGFLEKIKKSKGSFAVNLMFIALLIILYVFFAPAMTSF